MSLESIYYIGQTVAVTLIFVSLLALYLQRRQELKRDQLERNKRTVEALTDWLHRLRDDPEHARLIRVSTHYWEKMPENPKFVAHIFWTSVFMGAQRQIDEEQAGLGKGIVQDQVFQMLLGALVMPGIRAWWTQNKFWLSEEFYRAVDVRLEEGEGQIFPWHETNQLWQASERDLEIIIADEKARLTVLPTPSAPTSIDKA